MSAEQVFHWYSTHLFSPSLLARVLGLLRAVEVARSLARRHHVEISLLGLTGGDLLELEGQVKVSLADMRQAWEGGLEH